MLKSKENGENTTPADKSSIDLSAQGHSVSNLKDQPDISTHRNNENVPNNAPPAADTSRSRPESSEVNPLSPSCLATSLGVAEWAYGNETLLEALKVKAEHEKTKQEYYRFEGNKMVLEILEVAARLGVPGQSIPLLFSSNDAVRKAQASLNLTTQIPPISGNTLTATDASTTVCGGVPTSCAPNTHLDYTNAHVTPSPSIPSLLSGSGRLSVGNPGPLKSPKTPGRVSSTLNSPVTLIAPPSISTPSFQTQPIDPGGPPQSRMHHFDLKRYENGKTSSERFVPGHRVTVSALPVYGTRAGGDIHQPSSASGAHSPVQMSGAFYPPSMNSPNLVNAGQQRHIPRLTAPESPTSHKHTGSTAVSYTSPLSATATPVNQQNTQKLTHTSPLQGSRFDNNQHQHQHQPLVPVLNTMSSKSSRSRGREHAFSAGSDLQIYQWKPKQLLHDNRLNLSNPLSRKKGKNNDEAIGDLPISSAKHRTKRSLEEVHQIGNPALAAANHSYDQSLTQTSYSQPLSSNTSQIQPSVGPSNTAAVVAAQNNRRRSATHARRRSVASVSVDLGMCGDSEDVKRRNEGVAALASLASNDHQDISHRSEPGKLPTLLKYLECKADDQWPVSKKHVPGTEKHKNDD